jgi:hypothetical protein
MKHDLVDLRMTPRHQRTTVVTAPGDRDGVVHGTGKLDVVDRRSHERVMIRRHQRARRPAALDEQADVTSDELVAREDEGPVPRGGQIQC